MLKKIFSFTKTDILQMVPAVAVFILGYNPDLWKYILLVAAVITFMLTTEYLQARNSRNNFNEAQK